MCAYSCFYVGLLLCVMCCCMVWTVSTVLLAVHVQSCTCDVHARLYITVLILVYISDAPMQMKAKARVEEVEQRLRSAESTLHGELDELKRDYNRQVEQSQRLEKDHAQRDSEASTALARLDAVHAELEDKTYQLENTLAQLEKAELKAAKEARMRLELERSLRRLKNPGAMGSSASLLEGDGSFEQESGAANASAGRATVVNSRLNSQRSMYGATGVNSDASVDTRPRPSASASVHNSAHKPPLSASRARPSGLDVSHDDLASTSGASFIAAQEFDPARDLPSPIYHRTAANSGGPTSPLLRAAVLRGAGNTPESVARERRFFASGTNTANSSVASMQHHSYTSQSQSQQHASQPRSGEHRPAPARSHIAGHSLSSARLPQVPETQEFGEREYMHSGTSTIRSTYSTPDQSPEPAVAPASASLTGSGTGSVRNLQRSLESAAPGANKSNSAFDRAFQATSRIEEAMKAKGWKLNK
jgi:hypothetical protein